MMNGKPEKWQHIVVLQTLSQIDLYVMAAQGHGPSCLWILQ